MTQDELWMQKCAEVMDFIKTNHRKPSKHFPEERLKYHWIKHNKKLLNAGEMKGDMFELFNKLLSLGEKYKHVNQYH